MPALGCVELQTAHPPPRDAQTANSDFYVDADGSLRARAPDTSPATLSADGSTYSPVLQVVAATQMVQLSSDVSDDALAELKTIGITSPTGATVHLTVFGFVRMPPVNGVLGAVTIITHIGRIVIDGTSLTYFDDLQAALFEAAGFMSSPSRRLLQVRALFGIFNAVAAVSAQNNINGTTIEGQVPPQLPDSFIMIAKRACCARAAPACAVCLRLACVR
jgi:hypothetical protein